MAHNIMSGAIRQKEYWQLRQQTHDISQRLGTDIIQPTSAGSVLDASASQLQQQFPVRYDMYLSLLRQARQGKENRGKLATAAQKLTTMNRLDNYLSQAEQATDDGFTLRSRQFAAIQALRDQMESGKVTSRGYFRMPPRSGKTVIFGEIVKTLDVKTLVLVPTIDTGDQASEELAVRVAEEDLGKLYGGGKDWSKKVTVMSYQKLVRTMDAIKRKDPRVTFNPLEYQLVIMDEAHKGLEKVADAIRQFHFALKLGFTATDRYSEDKQVSKLLYPLISGFGIREGVEEGQNAPFTAYEAYIDADIRISSIKAVGGDYDQKELEKATDDERWRRATIKAYKDPRFFNRPTWVSCAGIDNAEKMAQAFNKTGIPAAVISQRNSLDERRAIRERFRKGELKILTFAKLLETGVNEPMLEGIINADPTMSVVRATQRGGRVLTLDPNNPRKHGFVIDLMTDDMRGITFSQVVENENMFGVTQRRVGERRRGPHFSIEPRVTVQISRVNIFTKEVLTILEDIAKVENATDWKEKRAIPADVLVSLLGQPAETIAAHLPHYLNGSSTPQKALFLQKEIDILRNYHNNPTADVELPLHIFHAMIIDAIYLRVSKESLIKQLPSVVENVLGNISAAREITEVVPYIAPLQSILQTLRKNNLSPDEQEQVLYLFEATAKGFLRMQSNRARGGKVDESSREMNQLISSVVTAFNRYRQDEYRQVVRQRIQKLLLTEPVSALGFLNAGQNFEGTDFYENIQDILSLEQVKKTFSQVEAAVFMSQDLPENIVSFARELKSSVESLRSKMPRSAALEARYEELQRFLTLAQQKQNIDQPDVVLRLYQEVSVSMQKLFIIVSNVMNAQAMQPTLAEPVLENMRLMMTGISACRQNVIILKEAIRQTMVDNPSEIADALSSYLIGKSMLAADFVQKATSNPRFVTARLRQVQKVPVTQKEPIDTPAVEVATSLVFEPQEEKPKIPESAINIDGYVLDAGTPYKEASTIDNQQNYVGQLQTFFQKNGGGEVYTQLERKFPNPYSSRFAIQVEAVVKDTKVKAVGIGRNLKEAKQTAAAAMLELLPGVQASVKQQEIAPAQQPSRRVPAEGEMKAIIKTLRRRDFISGWHQMKDLKKVADIIFSESLDMRGYYTITLKLVMADGREFIFTPDSEEIRNSKRKGEKRAALMAFQALYPELLPEDLREQEDNDNDSEE